MATAIANEAQMAAIETAEGQEEDTTLRIIKIKPAGNPKMFRTLTKAIAAGATTLIVTTRVDVAGCGYVWFGIRKGHTELDGKLLLNAQIWNYLLAFLMQSPGTAFSREELLAQVWGWDFSGGSRTVDAHVLTLRQKLGERADLLETVRGVGYRLKR